MPDRFARAEAADRPAPGIQDVGDDVDLGIAGNRRPAVLHDRRVVQLAEAPAERDQVRRLKRLVAEQHAAMPVESREKRPERHIVQLRQIDA